VAIAKHCNLKAVRLRATCSGQFLAKFVLRVDRPANVAGPTAVADLEGTCPHPHPLPFGRRTDAVTVLLVSENGSVLWRRHRQLTYKQVTATHQSKTTRRLSSLLDGVNAKM